MNRLSPEEELEIKINRIRFLVSEIPGLVLHEDVKCRAIEPCGPEVHNLHMTECYGMLHNHEGPHSWDTK